MATLIVLGQPAAGIRYVINKHRQAVLGRDPTCDVVLRKQSISRFHAQVLETQGNFYLEDMESTNGTFLNGRKVQKRTELQDGDRIAIHDVPIAFYLDDNVSLDEEMTSREANGKTPGSTTEFELPAASALPGASALKGRLQMLLKITRDLGSSLEMRDILPRVLDLLFGMFPQARIGEIHLVGPDGCLAPVAMKHGREADSTDLTGAPFNVDLLRGVLSSGQGLVRVEAASDPKLALDDFYQSTICSPIIGPAAAPFGVILLETDDSSHVFSDDDLELVSAVAVLAGQAIGYSRAHEIVVEHTNTIRQLETARQIQLSMLPRQQPQTPGYAFHHHYAPAEKVGGDFYFYEVLRDGRVILGIADASGKGLSAAMNIMRFAGEVKFRIATSPTLKSAVASLNQFVLDVADECMFITACICVLDPRQHVVAIANAGHPAPLLLRRGANSVETLTGVRRSFPLGISLTFELHPLTQTLEPGDQLLLFTDGVSEAMNPRNDLYGTERLCGLMTRVWPDLDGLVAAIVADVELFRDGRAPSDDTTILAFGRRDFSGV